MDSLLHHTTKLLKNRPLVVGTLCRTPQTLTQTAHQISQNYFDLLEIRLDSFLDSSLSLSQQILMSRHLIRFFSHSIKKPILLTLRAASDSGNKKHPLKNVSDQVREKIYQSVLDLVDVVDLEIRHTGFSKKMTREAHKNHVRVIHSYHEFRPNLIDEVAIKKWAAVSRKLKGDFFKVAVAPKTKEKFEKFLNLSESLPNENKILIGMGSIGWPSRLVGYSFGSLLTYGHFGVSAAPGQFHVNELSHFVNSYYGSSRA